MVLDSSIEDIWMPDLSMNDAGDACVVWDQQDVVMANVYSSANDAWSGAFPVWGGAESLQDPKCAMAGDGHFFVGWAYAPNAAPMDTMVTRCTSGGACEAPVAPDQTAVEDSFIYDLAASEDGTAMVTWDQFLYPPDNNTIEHVWAARYNGGWQAAVQLSSQVAGKAWAGDVSMDNAGNAVVFWIDYNPAGDDPRHLYAARYDAAAGSWVDQGLFYGNSSDDLYEHRGAIGADTHACVAWLQNDTDVLGSVWLPDGSQDLSSSWQSNWSTGPSAAMAVDCIVATVKFFTVRLHVWGIRPWK